MAIDSPRKTDDDEHRASHEALMQLTGWLDALGLHHAFSTYLGAMALEIKDPLWPHDIIRALPERRDDGHLWCVNPETRLTFGPMSVPADTAKEISRALTEQRQRRRQPDANSSPRWEDWSP